MSFQMELESNHTLRHSLEDTEVLLRTMLLQKMIWSKAVLKAGISNQSFQLFFKVK